MALIDLFKGPELRAQNEELKKVIEKLGALEYQQIKQETDTLHKIKSDLQQEISAYEAQISTREKQADALSSDIENKKRDLRILDNLVSLQDKLNQKKNELVVADEELLMESFALYKPLYAFVTSDEYRLRLDAVREDQKRQIKIGSAAIGGEGWTVNNSKSQGKKLTNDMKKLLIRAFNNECEAAVASVKFNNFDRCEARIKKTYDALNTLGKMMKVSLSQSFLALKIDELHIAHEYQNKLQEEKEERRLLREQQREEAKLLKEVEDARRQIDKEIRHYENALSDARKRLEEADAEEAAALKEKINELEMQIRTLDQQRADVDYRLENQKAGYVYIISNLGSFGEGIYKIGMTRRLEPMDRIAELSDASVPFNFDVHALIFSKDAPALEAALHRAFSATKLNLINQRREFFKVSLDEIKQIIKDNHDKSIEFIDIPPAEQYRESELLRQPKSGS